MKSKLIREIVKRENPNANLFEKSLKISGYIRAGYTVKELKEILNKI
jgi:hypothetical protein